MKLLIKKYLTVLFLCCLLSGLQSCSITPAQTDGQHIRKHGDPYLGISYKKSDTADGLKITQILPGPFEQATFGKLNFDFKHDRLIQVNDISVSAKNFKEVIAKFQPGQTVSLLFRKGDTELNKWVTVNITLGHKSDWTGPISKANLIKPDDIRYAHVPDITTENPITTFINKEVKKSKLNKQTSQLYDLLNNWQLNNSGFNTLSRVTFPFKHPEKLMELESIITAPLANLNHDNRIIFNEIAKNLDLHLPYINSCPENYSWDEMLLSIQQSHALLNETFGDINASSIKTTSEELYYFLTNTFKLYNKQYKPVTSVNALNMSMEVDFNALLSSSALLHCYLDKNLALSNDSIHKDVPYKIKNAIKGNIKDLVQQDGLWIVHGSDDDNTYDMSVIDVVYDPDGNDIYLHKKNDSINLKLIIDKDGNDKYLGTDIGAATGWFGISLLIDHKGNDIYEGKIAANGTGIMGIGILVDYSGIDRYTGDYFSNGVGFYGAGSIIDLGKEADVYHSASFSQGFGGPRGLGLIYENSGNDLYRANSITSSAYGTPAVYLSFSQGVGFGIRHFDSGGIGIIYDKHGSDRYEGGEFSQAGGYYWGLGIIHDDEGHDHYYGNRYSQGFAAHQATGILLDREGNDNYWGMTAACQGSAWDVAMGLLLDVKGNDTYRGDGLCQGAAAMQAMGWLIDLDGTDHYSSNSKSSQGHSGNNTYHYNKNDPVYSWSLLLDAGGDIDHYSNERENNQVRQYSEFNKEDAAESLIHGLFIDYSEVINQY